MMFSPWGLRETKPSWSFRETRWSTKLYRDFIHLKKTLATATLPVFTKRGVASFSNLWTKKLKCFWLPVHLLPVYLCSFFYGSPVASRGCGWIPSPSFHSSLAFFSPSRAKRPHTCTWYGVESKCLCSEVVVPRGWGVEGDDLHPSRWSTRL